MGLLKRFATKNGDSFVIKTEEGVFKIFLDENFNLVLSCVSALEKKDFTIIPNDEIYPFFNSLYNSIMSSAPYIDFPKNFPNRDKVFANDLLFFGDKIIYNSDNSNGNVLTIEKNDNYIISFEQKESINEKAEVLVSFSDSKYLPYNLTFINMYERIKNYWSTRGHTFSKGKSRVRK